MKNRLAIIVCLSLIAPAFGCNQDDASDKESSPLNSLFKKSYSSISTVVSENDGLHYPFVISANRKGAIYFLDGTTFQNPNRPHPALHKVGPNGGMQTVHVFSDGDFPEGIAVNESEDVYFSAGSRHVIKCLRANGEISFVAGSSRGYKDGPSTRAKFSDPHALTLDASGNLYVVDVGNNAIRKVTPSGLVTTVARSSKYLSAMHHIDSIAADESGNVYLPLTEGWNVIACVTAKGEIKKYAGAGGQGLIVYRQGAISYEDGDSSAARFNDPDGVALDSEGNLFVADTSNNMVRRIEKDGTVTTIAGTGEAGFQDGSSSTAMLSTPISVAVDNSGSVYVTDMRNNAIRKIY